MPTTVLRLPEVKRQTETRPVECPHFHGVTFQH
jgi:hypothetical protein